MFTSNVMMFVIVNDNPRCFTQCIVGCLMPKLTSLNSQHRAPKITRESQQLSGSSPTLTEMQDPPAITRSVIQKREENRFVQYQYTQAA